jgi:hypothetical protein
MEVVIIWFIKTHCMKDLLIMVSPKIIGGYKKLKLISKKDQLI